MPDKGAQDKTEKPTPKRRSKAREEGQVAKSQEISSVGVLLAGASALYLFGGFIYNQLSGLMAHIFQSLGTLHLSTQEASGFAGLVMNRFLETVWPIWLVVSLAAVLTCLAQVGFMMAPKRIKPDLKNISPLKGIKRFASLKLLVDLFKNIGKLVVVGGAAVYTVWQEWDELPALARMENMEIMLAILDLCFTIFVRALIVMIVLAILDWAYQKYDFEKNLKMSKQEVKDEHKQSEGDPQVKGRIRTLQREASKKRMMNSIPQADVVVTNPTHLAVALAYQVGEMDAPTVVAKGADRMAQRIKEIAREHGVPLVEDKPLAQALYQAVEVGQAIPADMFEAVASVLAHVYRMKNKHREVLAGARRAEGR